jgi:hypothetical protein
MSGKEHYHAKPMGANSTLKVGVLIAGFLPTVAGTLTVTDADGTVLVNALPVALGPFIRIPLIFDTTAGGSVTLGGGAAGTLFL